jgi:hypothetical protein
MGPQAGPQKFQIAWRESQRMGAVPGGASRSIELTHQYLLQRLSRWTDIENGDLPNDHVRRVWI